MDPPLRPPSPASLAPKTTTTTISKVTTTTTTTIHTGTSIPAGDVVGGVVAPNKNDNDDADIDNDDIVAIDFQKLYQEEKRKVKEERLLRRIQERLQKNSSSSDRACNMTSNKDRNNNNNNNNNECHQESTGWDVVPKWTWENSDPLFIDTSTSTICTSNIITTFVPNMIHYAKDFIINTSYRDTFLQWLHQLPENDLSSSSTSHANHHQYPKNTDTSPIAAANGKWTILPHAQRRVALFDTKVQVQQKQQSNDVTMYTFPPPLQLLIDTLIQAGVYDTNDNNNDDYLLPNHILINEYVQAHQGILPHTDGPAYHPKTITISFGLGNVLLHFTPMKNNNNESNITNQNEHDNPTFQMLLHGGGSIIIFENDAYTNYYHSINDLSSSSTSEFLLNQSNSNTAKSTTSTETNGNQGGDDETATMEYAGPNCYNAEPGTCVVRQPNRISITIRHKLE